ncbi:RusA family crossover junction endodeoxyribonuclease [Leptothoe sp. LEGE 181152]|nr:RusA family crossover junction endodeoxyribonuclease [Leptothoe sp. LEGE 181152]
MSVYTFNLDGPIVPKARARTTANGTYHPHRYNNWKKGAIASISNQYQGQPLEYAEITISLSGKHNRQGDADNVAGSVLDALVQAKVLVDDNMKRVPSLAICLDWQKKAEPKAVVVLSTGRKAA